MCDAAGPLPHFFFFEETRAARILPHSSRALSLCSFKSNASWLHKSLWVHMWRGQPLPDSTKFFQGKRASQEGLLAVTAIDNFHLCPSQEEGKCWQRSIVCKGDVGYLTFKCSQNTLVKAMLCYVTHNSAKRMSLSAKRLGCQRWHTTECLLEAECNEIVFGMCSVERGSMGSESIKLCLANGG